MSDAIAHSVNEYGTTHAHRYETLILAALDDVAADYKCIGAVRVSRSVNVWVYEIRFSSEPFAASPTHSRAMA
ncbi:MAG TPA: hypothetical protein VGG99_04805 [Acetobacteraceae bacterium]|jgi:hypothetical protein